MTDLARTREAENEAAAREEALAELERRVIVSLRRAVENPHSELERPSDWIDHDPDFQLMRDHEEAFGHFLEYRLHLRQQDYPFTPSECPVPHADVVSANEPVPLVACLAPALAVTDDGVNHAPVLMTKKRREQRTERTAGAGRLSSGHNPGRAGP